MDIVSHALMGCLLAWITGDPLWVLVLLSIASDIPQMLILYPYLAIKNRRWFPLDTDWEGFSDSKLAVLYFAPHSLWALGAIALLPITHWGIVAYALHLFVDAFSHTGEWSIRPLYPHSWAIEGFYDGWKVTSAWKWLRNCL